MAGDPNNREGLTLKGLAPLCRHGKSLFDQTNYDASYRTLTTLPTEAGCGASLLGGLIPS
jgi:hypothetical protein